jgi:hypothetical protein
LNLREIIEADVTPFYIFELAANDLVVVRPRKLPSLDLNSKIKIPEWADEKAREIAREKGWDYQSLKRQWLTFANSEVANGNAPKNPGAAFVGYCKKQNALR